MSTLVGGGGGKLEQRGGRSSVFEALVRGRSFNFQLPMGGGSSYFITEIGTHLKVLILLEHLNTAS